MFSWGELFSTFMARKIMGAKHSFRSPNGGGCPFLYALHTAKVAIFYPTAPSPFLAPIVLGFQTKRAKTGQKLYFICLLWCFLGKIGDNEGQNPNIFLKTREENGLKPGRPGCSRRVHWWQVVGFRGCPFLLWCVSSFCPLSRSSLGALLANMALFRVFRGFLEGFSCLVWVCVALVICVACGAFVCV